MKQIKKAAALLLAVIFAFALTGCNEIRKMKENQAFWAGPEDKGTIEWDGRTYRQYTGDDYKTGYATSSYSIRGYVTEKDVPALLQENYGKPFSVSANRYVMTVDYDAVYIRSDVYDEITKAMEGRTDTVYYTKTYHYSMNDDNVQIEIRELSDDVAELILAVLGDDANRRQDTEFGVWIEEAGYTPVDSLSGIFRSNAYFSGVIFDEECIGSADLYEKNGQKRLVFFDYQNDGCWYLVPDSETEMLVKALFP